MTENRVHLTELKTPAFFLFRTSGRPAGGLTFYATAGDAERANESLLSQGGHEVRETNVEGPVVFMVMVHNDGAGHYDAVCACRSLEAARREQRERAVDIDGNFNPAHVQVWPVRA